MKVNFYITLGILFCALTVNNSFAADGDIENAGDPGTPVTITHSVAGAQPIVFNPSTNVNILGQSDSTSFAVSGWHEQADQKDSGQAYLMTADENKMFFMDISSAGETAPVASDVGTNFTDFGGNWNTL